MILTLVKVWLAGLLLDSLRKDMFGRFGTAAAPASPAARPIPTPRGAPPTQRPTPGAAAVAPPGAPPQPAPTVRASMPATSAPPWPLVPASDLPPFPGPGWEPDHPPPAAVVQRSMALLPHLWGAERGERWVKIEQTAGRWIAYQATRMPNNVKGVVAWRLRGQGRRTASAPTASAPTASAPTAPASHVTTLPEMVITPRETVPASTSQPVSTALPTLRRGARGENVALVQRHLGIKDDGIFGPMTENSVRAYQSAHGLVPDGIVGPKTWGSMLGAGQAA